MNESGWPRRESELHGVRGSLERFIDVIRGAEAMGLYWKVWRDGQRLNYVVSPNRAEVIEELGEQLPVLEGL